MSKIIGIDLGTTNSVVAVMEGSEAKVIPNAEGNRTTPSIVAFSKGGERLVGQVAKRQAVTNPENTVFSIKRFMGRRYDEVNEEMKMVPFEVKRIDNGDVRIAAGDKEYSPPEISAMILQKLRASAEDYLGEKVERAVITVPAYFNDAQRQATKDAGKIAGLTVERLVNEPTAAALAYGLDRKKDELIAVYDFGGGTFDATTMTMDDKGIYLLAKTGATDLGGKELDERVGELILDQFQRALGRKLALNALTLLELRRASEAIKIELSTPGTREVRKPVLIGSDVVEIRIDREQFSRTIAEIIERTVAVAQECLKDAGLVPNDVDTLLLVGGSSLIPDVSPRLREVFPAGATEMLYHEPSKAVALGAALRSAQVSGDHQKFNLPPELKGVSGYSVGVRAVDPHSGEVTVDTLIRKNMPLPTTIRKTYYTARPDQRTMVLDVVQYRGDVTQAVSIGNLTVGPLTNPRAGYPIGVRIDYRENGTVHVIASDANTGMELEQSFGGDSAGDVEYFVAQRKQLQSILMTRP